MKYGLILLLAVVSCQQIISLSEKELGAYVLDAENGLVKSIESSRLKVQVYYKPTGMLVAQELAGTVDTLAYEKLYEKYEQYAYFVMDISVDGKNALYQSTDQQMFSEHLQTLAFRMDQYANLTTSNLDTIPVGDFVYPRMFGMTQSATVMFVFNASKLDSVEWFSFNLSEFGMGTGIRQFNFEMDDIKAVPLLQM